MIRCRRNNVFPQIWRLGGEQKGRNMDETVDRGGLCRGLIRHQAYAVLATSLPDGSGNRPYASLVAVACDIDASPLLFISDLAQHSRNIAVDNRVSLLFDGDHPKALHDPLAAPRLSLLGQAEQNGDPRLLARFIARHPSAADYASFADFHLYRVTIGRGHLVAGFGRISWIESDELRFPADARALGEAAAEIIAHMNADHAEAIGLYAALLLGRGGAGWRMTGIDPEGIDLRNNNETARLDFSSYSFGPVLDPEDARRVLVALATEARIAASI